MHKLPEKKEKQQSLSNNNSEVKLNICLRLEQTDSNKKKNYFACQRFCSHFHLDSFHSKMQYNILKAKQLFYVILRLTDNIYLPEDFPPPHSKSNTNLTY